ncbi:MAG: 3'-5' exonuclease [Patescibacteria group bacterium]|nr:3'-5' exonuclease [Patescibacteria group bacterium]
MTKPVNKAKPIAVTDVETTGLAAGFHEIIEIGLVLLAPDDLRTISELSLKVKPRYPFRMDWGAARVNGYCERDWCEAVDLETALWRYVDLTDGAVFAAHNVNFDWSFMSHAFETTGIRHSLAPHMLCTMAMAGDRLRPHGLQSRSLKSVATFLGLPPEAEIHRAINGARLAAEIYRKLAEK